MLRIAHIATDGPQKRVRERKLTDKEILHREVLETKAARLVHDEDKAKKLFSPEWDEIRQLHEKLAVLKQMC